MLFPYADSLKSWLSPWILCTMYKTKFDYDSNLLEHEQIQAKKKFHIHMIYVNNGL